MPACNPTDDVPVKIGPPVGIRKLRRLNSTITSPTKVQPGRTMKPKVQPGRTTKSCHRIIKLPTNQPTSDDVEEKASESTSTACCPAIMPRAQRSSQGLTDEEREEEYLNSFHTKLITLKDSQKLDHYVALDQLRDMDGSEQYVPRLPLPVPPNASTDDDASSEHPIPLMDSEDDKQLVKDTTRLGERDDAPINGTDSETTGQMSETDGVHGHSTSAAQSGANVEYRTLSESSGEDSDWLADERQHLKLEQMQREIIASNYDVDNHPSTPPINFSSSKEDEEQATDTDKLSDAPRGETKTKSACSVARATGQFASTSAMAGSEEFDADDEGEGTRYFKPGRLPANAIKKAQALGKHTTEEAQSIADEYGKSLGTIMGAAGLSAKATRAESVWNMHQAWYADAYPKDAGEGTKGYQVHQLKHYEAHKDKEEHAQLWKVIRVFWTESIAGIKDVSVKGMVGWLMSCRDSFAQAAQTWCNVEGIHILGCVLYTGSLEAPHQVQGIFAGSSVCMELASEKQTDISQLLDYLATIIKYKTSNPAASMPLPQFSVLPQLLYNPALALKPQESRHDHNHHVLPLILMHKFYEVKIIRAQKNVFWKSVLNLLYVHRHKIIDWPAGVPAVALTVPFLKEQMGAAYHAEEDDEGAGVVVSLPKSSLYLRDWTPEQCELVEKYNPQMFSIPLVINTHNRALRLLSDSQTFLNGIPKHMEPPD
ncbi:hypothetical protein SCLCIDRAFT_31365 [Scleroderma citrinum Foug A]|uniref:Uncharacterized protein n=1 Tax=Scleroderma citrinum Foug A TaxID=1036808 RepID=A0A0C3DCK8_9AGAM|nr:hypothetical protein SCLCIDRAFT_31365 [Scleroderma citrinum Foug A]